MRVLKPGSQGAVILALSFSGIGLLSAPSPVAAQAQYAVRPVAEMKVKQLPKGELFWHVESFPTLDEAKAAAPPYRWNPDTVSYDGLPSLTAEVAGKAWLFTLGPKGGTTAGGTKVAEIGPFLRSARPSTCCASTTAMGRRVQRHRCIRIPAPKHFTLSLAGWANGPRRER